MRLLPGWSQAPSSPSATSSRTRAWHRSIPPGSGRRHQQARSLALRLSGLSQNQDPGYVRDDLRRRVRGGNRTRSSKDVARSIGTPIGTAYASERHFRRSQTRAIALLPAETVPGFRHLRHAHRLPGNDRRQGVHRAPGELAELLTTNRPISTSGSCRPTQSREGSAHCMAANSSSHCIRTGI